MKRFLWVTDSKLILKISKENIMSVGLSVSIIFLLSVAVVHSDSDPLVRTESGIIRGRIRTTPKNTSYYAFQEVPYAAPPIGNLRFQSPQPVKEWTGILNTTENTKICHQVLSDSDMESEDCLYLNIYTPKLPARKSSSLLPVIFNIHGGGFVVGDGLFNYFGPDFLIEHGVVIVSIFYRLGPFGFLSTQDDVIPGNNGLKDQQFALKWVNRNIKKFGGDPSKVTILGQSSGAASVGYHLLNRNSPGLFRAAVLESGTALCPSAYQRNARYYAYQTALAADPTFNLSSTSRQLRDFLMNVSSSQLDKASLTVVSLMENYTTNHLLQGSFYAPVLETDRENGFVIDKMHRSLEKGEALRVPILIGINSEEAISPRSDAASVKAQMSDFDNDPQWLVPNDMNFVENRDLVGRVIRKFYVGDGQFQDNPGLSVKYLSDATINRASVNHVFLQKKFSDVYFYQFSYDGALGHTSGNLPDADHVGHSGELPYLWRMNSRLANNYNLSEYSEADILTHKRMVSMWINFVKTLNPTPEESALLQNITWPKASSFGSTKLAYLDIGVNLEIKNNPKSPYIGQWNFYYELFGNPPFDTY